MTSLPIDAVSLLDAVLIVALLATAAYAVGLRREFRRFRAYNEEYAAVLAQTGRAMEGRGARRRQRPGRGRERAPGARRAHRRGPPR